MRDDKQIISEVEFALQYEKADYNWALAAKKLLMLAKKQQFILNEIAVMAQDVTVLEYSTDKYNLPIEDLEIGIRGYNAIVAHIHTLKEPLKTFGDILTLPHSYFLKIPNFGRNSLSELVGFFKGKGIEWNEWGNWKTGKEKRLNACNSTQNKDN